MNTVSALEEELVVIESTIKDMECLLDVDRKKRDAIKQRIAELRSKFKVGDRVTIEGNDYKSRFHDYGNDVSRPKGEIWQITKVSPGFPEPELTAAKIKKDGTPGKVTQRLWIWRGQKLVLVNDQKGEI